MTNRLLFLIIFIANLSILQAQTYHNDWIDHNKVYHKFKVVKDGLYQIPYATLDNAGINTVGAGFQLFHNGEQIPIHVTTDSNFEAGDYIEFYGKKNDGTFDTQLFADPEWQLTNAQSLFTDTASYFLTWDNSTPNLRYTSIENNLANVPPKEDYFMHQVVVLPNEEFNEGVPFRVADRKHHFADFENGEGFVSELILAGESQTFTLETPAIWQTTSELVEAMVKVVGRNDELDISPDHHLGIEVGGASYVNDAYDGYAVQSYTFNPDIADLADESLVTVTSLGDLAPSDQNAVAYVSLTYPRAYDFGNERTFSFVLNNESERYIEIENFIGGSAPVLYDRTNRLRILPIQESGVYKIKLPGGTNPSTKRQLFVANTTSFISVNEIENLEVVVFTDFANSIHQGNYLLITHPHLRQGITDWVEAYHDFRGSFFGGDFGVQTVEIDQLYDQFAYGIAKHPLAIRHFINFAMDNWTTTPEYLLLLGNSVAYNQTTHNPTNFEACLVPAFGSPPSDALLTAKDPDDYMPQLAVGRVPASSSGELRRYLDKLMQYELTGRDPFCSEETAWRKNVMSLIHGETEEEATELAAYLPPFQETLADGGYGAQFTPTYTDAGLTENDTTLAYHLKNGVGLMVYMGHSTGGNWFHNVPVPAGFDNEGRYPVIFSSSFFEDNIHTVNDLSYAAEHLFANNRGAIAFADNLTYGVPELLNDYTSHFLNALSYEQYGQGMGVYMQQATAALYIENPVSELENATKLMLQTYALAGDPAVSAIPNRQADFYIHEDDIQFINPFTNVPIFSIPADITDLMAHFDVRFTFTNLGKAVDDSVNINILRVFPDASYAVVATDRVPIPAYEATMSIEVQNNLPDFSGLNSFLVQINVDNEVDEYCLNDNTAGKISMIQSFCENFPTVDLGPDIIFLEGESYTLDAGNPGLSYEWSTGETTQTITVNMQGDYWVIVEDEDGCKNVDQVSVMWPVGVESNDSQEFIKTYPNPVETTLFVELPTNKGAWTIDIYNLQGQIVLSQQAVHQQTSFDMAHLQNGLYLVKMVSEDEVVLKKVLKGK